MTYSVPPTWDPEGDDEVSAPGRAHQPLPELIQKFTESEVVIDRT